MLYILFILFLGAQPIFAQDNKGQQKDNKEKKTEEVKVFKKRTVMKDVKTYYKAANYSKVDETIRNAFKTYKEAGADPDLLGYEMNAQYQLYLDENKKIFLNNKGDTAKFFSYIYNTYTYGLKCDSACAIPDKKGKTVSRYASDINNHLSSLRNNLKSGGMYYMKKQKYGEALPFYKMYIKTLSNPIVYKKRNGTMPADTDSARIYQLALHAAYGAQKYQDVLNFLPVAMKDSVKKELVLEMAAKSSLQLGDTLRSVGLMNEGFDEYPDNEYFKANLIKYYHDKRDLAETMRVLNRCIQTDSVAPKYWKLKGNEYYVIDSLDQAAIAYSHVVEIDKDDVESLIKLATIYSRKARAFYDSTNLKIGAPYYNKNRQTLTCLYESAMGYYERVRELKPDEPSLWENGLKEAYYRLNKGEELKKLEKK